MNILRIAVISYHTCPLSDEKNADFGGMNTYVLELSKALAEKGYIIDIFAKATDKNSPAVIEVSLNLKVYHLQAEDISEFSNNLYEIIKKEKISYDLISAHYYLSGLVGLKLKEKINIPLFVTFHTLALMKNLVIRSQDEKENLERIKSEILLTKKADKIIATSESDLAYIHTLYSCPLERTTLLSPGVNLKLFKPIDKLTAKKFIKANPSHKIILFVGRMDPLKGIDVLLYTIKILIQKHPKLAFCLWVVGGKKIADKKELQHLEEIRKALGITSYVKFVNNKTQEELLYYYNSAEIVLMPSQYESFGMAALEAMACAVPAIITDVTGIAGLLNRKHQSLLTSASNPIRLAQKINNLLTNTKEHKKMSQEVFKKVQDLSWENTALKSIQILRR